MDERTLATEHIMGTAVVVEVGAGVPRSGAASEAVTEAVRHLCQVESRFSPFLADSEIVRIRQGRLQLRDAHRDVQDVVADCDILRIRTRRAFDHLSGGLDPTGYVKGWAVEGAARHLEHAGIDDFMIWAGGDILVRRPRTADRGWTVGIRHPANQGRSIDAVELYSGAVATSGCYARGEHIRKRDKVNSPMSASVIGPDLGVADALATAVLSAGLENIGWLARFPDYRLIALDHHDKIYRTHPGDEFGASLTTGRSQLSA